MPDTQQYYPATLTFTEQEREAFLARTDRKKGETIITPYIAFIDQFLGDWISISPVDPNDWGDDLDDDDLDLPLATPSGYVIELATEDDRRVFEWQAVLMRAQTNELTTFKANWPFIVTLRDDSRERPDIPDDLPAGSDLTLILYGDEIAFARANAKAGFDTFASDLFEEEVVHFGFAREEDAVLFKLFWLEGA